VGGRWNHRGTPLVYLAESIALATLEVLVHLQDTDTLSKYALVQFSFDASLVQELPREHLPEDWAAFPHPLSTRTIGEQWVSRGSSALLKVPSAVSPREANYLLNPRHPDVAKVKVGSAFVHTFDPRLTGP
jgi:RES domain-containing protein